MKKKKKNDYYTQTLIVTYIGIVTVIVSAIFLTDGQQNVNADTAAEPVTTNVETEARTEAYTETEPETEEERTETETPSTASDFGVFEAESDEEAKTYVYVDDNGISVYFDHDLQDYLRQRLSDYGIEWFFDWAVCMAKQESNFDPDDVTEYSNGTDCGLFSFRERWWREHLINAGLAGDESIFDPFAQIDVLCWYAAKRIRKGLPIEMVVSSHYTGGEGYNAKYWNDVRRWYSKIRIEGEEDEA